MGLYGGKRALMRLAVGAEPGKPGDVECRGHYRVEHHVRGMRVVLARVQTAIEHAAELDLYASRLQAAGQAAGRLVLIEEGSGRIVACRTLARPVRTYYRMEPQRPRPSPTPRRPTVAPIEIPDNFKR